MIIDPFQSTDWHNIGITNLKRAGFDFFELIEKPSENLAYPPSSKQVASFNSRSSMVGIRSITRSSTSFT